MKFGVEFMEAFRSKTIASRTLSFMSQENYLLNYNPSTGIFMVVLNEDADNDHVLKAILHMSVAHNAMKGVGGGRGMTEEAVLALIRESLSTTTDNHSKFVRAIKSSGFSIDSESFSWLDEGARLQWKRKLL